MEPVTKILLATPGMDELQSGPDSAWMQQIGANLDLVLRKYTDKPLQIISSDSKNTNEFSGQQVYLIALMHTSYPPSGKYLKFLEKMIAEAGNAIQKMIRIDASPEIHENSPGFLAEAGSIEIFELLEGGNQTDWITEEHPAYWSRLLDLAVEIKNRLGSDSEQVKVKGNMIYLAQAAADMGKNRDILKRELMEHGFRILPESDLKLYKKDIKSQVQNLIDKSIMAIHMIGNSYGEVLKDSGSSLADMQVRYITEYLEAIENDPKLSGKELNRLIWIDPEFKPVDSKQEEFINQIKRNIENLHRTEIIQTPLELFKTLIIKRLRKDAVNISERVIDVPVNGKFIYLLHSGDDQKQAAELAGGLAKGGLATGMLNFEKGQKNLLSDHKKYLQVCDAAIVFYGKENRLWLRSKVMDLLKAPGMGRVRTLETRHILAGGKDTLEDFKIPDEISITREPDLSKAVSQLLKNLK